jgi:hypothetical protein
MKKTDKIDSHIESIINGEIPKQDSYTYDEVRKIALIITSWCAEQIDHTADYIYSDKKDIENFVSNAGFKSIEEALEDTHEFIRGELLELREFVFTHLN